MRIMCMKTEFLMIVNRSDHEYDEIAWIDS